MFHAYIIWIIFTSAAAFILYGADKLRAKRGRFRIPEKILLGTGAVGGAVGALLAMQAFRHKTKHAYFWVVNIAALLLHVAVGVLLFLKAGT